jgi:hypothetical protein
MVEVAEISVVLPTYQGARHVEQSVRSVLAQQGVGFELIVCDDGSSDDTLARVQALADDRVRVLQNPRNRGLFPSLNRLMGEASADLVHLWSQDDVMLPGCLDRAVAFGRAHGELPGFYCAYEVIDERGVVVEPPDPNDRTPEVIEPELATRILFFHGSISGNIANTVVRKSALAELGPFREDLRLSGDYEMWIRMTGEHAIGRIPEPGVQIRRHSGQLSRRGDSELQFVVENQALHDALLARMPASHRSEAEAHQLRHHDAQVVHAAVRRVARGDLGTAAGLMETLRARGVLAASSAAWARGLAKRLRRRLG